MTTPPSPAPGDTGRRIGIAAAIWTVSIFLSRVIGLVREFVIGRIMGGGAEADVYWTAFVVPDFLNHLLAGGALSIVFIPIFGAYLARGEERKAWDAFSVIANALLLALGVLTVALWAVMPWLVPVVAPGFDEAQSADLVALSRIILPAQIFHVVGGLLSASLQARDRHALPALAPLLYTGSIVVAGVVLGPEWGAYGFAWGVLVGSVLGPFGLPLVGCLRTGLGWRPILRWDADLKTYLVQSLPIMLGWSIVLVDDWIQRREGSWLDEGSISTLQYAKTLMRVPMGVFGLATGVAAYPTLARLIAEGRPEEAFRTLSDSTRRMLVLAFASQVALTVAGAEIAMVVYGSKLLPGQHAAIGVAIGFVSLGLWAWSAQTVVSRGFYVVGNTWLPTVAGSLVALACYPLYVVLARSWGTAGLSMASSVAITAYVVLLILLLRRRFGGQSDGYGPFFLRVVPAVAAGIGAGLALGRWLPAVPPFGEDVLVTYGAALLRGSVLAGVGLVVFAAVAALLRLPEARDVARLLGRRLRR